MTIIIIIIIVGSIVVIGAISFVIYIYIAYCISFLIDDISYRIYIYIHMCIHLYIHTINTQKKHIPQTWDFPRYPWPTGTVICPEPGPARNLRRR